MARPSHNIWPQSGVTISHGEGALFWDTQGKRYIDLSCQTMNLLYGQSHPVLGAAIKAAWDKYTFVDQDFISREQNKAIEELSALLPKHLEVYNVRMNDGSSAVECAVKQARRHTGRAKVLTVDGIYLGQNTQTIHLRGWGKRPDDILRGGSEDVVFAPIPFPNYDRELVNCPDEDGRSIAELIEKLRGSLSCVLVDPIMISSGVTTGRAMKLFLKRTEEACKLFGIPLILDECQTFGWVPDFTLTRNYDIATDILILGKSVGGGLPLAICASRPEYDNLNVGDADYTNGGTATAIAGLSATCALLTDPTEQAAFEKLCILLESLVQELVAGFPGMLRTRGVGLIRAIEFCAARDKATNRSMALAVAEELLEHGVYIRCHMTCLTIKLPRVITATVLREAIAIIESIIGKWFKPVHGIYSGRERSACFIHY
jgi:4-aminobutyrate aminotransferase